MVWEVRKAKLEDANSIVKLSLDYDRFLMPYVLSRWVVSKYIDQFYVAERVEYQPGPHYEVRGAVHFVGNQVDYTRLEESDKLTCFLLFVKQVPVDIVTSFIQSSKDSKVALLGQIVCPGKGSFYAILEELKKQFDELWCWMSVVGPSYESYKRYGFTFWREREFWNVYKCGYSRFTLGLWRKDGS